MIRMPELSVSAIIPTYNRVELVSRAIRSVLAAISPGDEVMVVDDGSTDGTVAAVEAFGGPVRLLEVPHGGAGPARNAGIAAARGDLISFLDSDDEWYPDKVELQRTFLERRPDVLYVWSDLGVKTEDGGEHHHVLARWASPPRPLAETFGPGIPYSSVAALPAGRDDFEVYIGQMSLKEMLNPCISPITVMTRRREAGPGFRFAEDFPVFGEEWPAAGALSTTGVGALLATDTAWQHGHAGSRLTEAPMSAWAEARLLTLERVWAKDRTFLAAHRKEYRHASAEARLIEAISGAHHGKAREGLKAIPLAFANPRALVGGIRRVRGRSGW
jgi:glycosyltransferase involved in cell wall biosynthesis